MAINNWVGSTLSDRYEIVELLGQGGMSAVYKAKDPNLRRVVAVKVILAHLSSDPEFVRRFEEEAAAVARLRHPNIIQVYDFNQDEGNYYMVMELVPGETLQERLRRFNAEGRHLPLDQAIQFAQQICEAADYAHNRGMIHRDIKPANVMLDVYGQAILMDFGIAKIFGGEQHTATGAVIGTAKYMAPEQIRGERIDGRTDVYAIGVTLFEMLSGAPPFEADSAMTLMMKHLNDPVPDLRTIQPRTPERLVAVVEKALAKSPAVRYQSAAEMASALKTLLEGASEMYPVSAATVKDGVEDYSTEVVDQSPEKTSIDGAAAGVAGYVHAQFQADAGAYQGTVPVSKSDLPGGAGSGEAAPYPTPPPVAPVSAKKSSRVFIAVGAVLALMLLCLIAGGAYAFNQFSGNGDEDTAGTTQTAESIALGASMTDILTPTETQEPEATFTTAPPTATPTPEKSPTPTLSPTPTIPPGVPYVRINDISLDAEGNYLVDYEVFEFTDQLLLDGFHLTFFFDNIPPDQVGSPYETPYYMYAGPSPFAKFHMGLRSDAAQSICALVTKPDHVVIQESGTCFPLPELQSDMEILKPGAGSSQGDPGTPTPTLKPTKDKDNNSDY